MKVYSSLQNASPSITPLFLTIGNFDGVHLGHQALLKNLKDNAKQEGLESAVITFSNHPSTVLRQNHPIPLLTSKEHKLKLLEAIGIDHVFMLDFTLPFSKQSAENFLRKIQEKIIFRRLILGQDAKLGHDRQGNTPLLHELARTQNFTLDFLNLEEKQHEVITSSRIRHAIQNAELDLAAQLLGRKYSILGKVEHGSGKGKSIGYPTLNLALHELCYPPFGVYRVTVQAKNKTHAGVANVGIAPTMRNDHIPLLETFLWNHHEDLYHEIIEVTFEQFIRPERIFGSIEELKEQIKKDVAQAQLGCE